MTGSTLAAEASSTAATGAPSSVAPTTDAAWAPGARGGHRRAILRRADDDEQLGARRVGDPADRAGERHVVAVDGRDRRRLAARPAGAVDGPTRAEVVRRARRQSTH